MITNPHKTRVKPLAHLSEIVLSCILSIYRHRTLFLFVASFRQSATQLRLLRGRESIDIYQLRKQKAVINVNWAATPADVHSQAEMVYAEISSGFSKIVP